VVYIEVVMNEITFGKERYYQQGAMEVWCAEHIGRGGWTYSTPQTWEGMAGKIWVMFSMFGNTTFCFKEEKHLTFFLLRWS
jgi:hypothetical protein